MSSTVHTHSSSPEPGDSSDRPVRSAESRKVQPSGRSPLAVVTGAQILSTGCFAPAEVVRNEDLSELGFDADWIVQRTGIRERRRAAEGIVTSDVAYEAAVACLEAADVSPSELDLILVATITPDMPMPSTACFVQHKLGARAPAMDINAACAGFMYALVTGMQFVANRAANRVLVIGADLMSRTVNPVDRKTYPLFGDGAGAVLLGPADRSRGLLAYTLGADGSGSDLLWIPGGGTVEPLTSETISEGRQYLAMDGRAVFKWAVRMIQDAAEDVLHKAELTLDDISLVVFHQANMRIIDAAIDGLGIDRERVFVNLDRYGNTSAASIPLVLAEAQAAGRIHEGDHILLAGFGAGLAWGAGVLRW